MTPIDLPNELSSFFPEIDSAAHSAVCQNFYLQKLTLKGTETLHPIHKVLPQFKQPANLPERLHKCRPVQYVPGET